MTDTLIQFWIGLLEITAILSVLAAILLAATMVMDLRSAEKDQDRTRRHDDAV